MYTGIIFDIKKFSIHDGPGIRTTIFLKGCPLNCWWCHNPESQAARPERVFRENRCIDCETCLAVCREGAISKNGNGIVTHGELCTLCGDCVEACYADAREIIGREVIVAEVMAEIERDIAFYDESGGGVTFSGGEPLLQRDFLRALLQACREKEIHTTVDTSGFAPWTTFEYIRSDVDLFLYDLKLMDNASHQKFTGVPNLLILQNLQSLSRHGHNIIERLYASYMPVPFLSLLIDDCIATGKDYHNGGARYNTSDIQGVGLGTITDTFTAIKYHVFDQHTLTMSNLLTTLENDFEGYRRTHRMLLNRTPKFGNDDDYADAVMIDIFEAYFNAIDGRPNTRGGEYRINLLPTTVHVYFGSVIGATPDGRRANMPLSEGISPVQGADRHGPTAVIKSAAKMDHIRTGGTLLNQKFTPQLLKDDEGLDKLAQLVRTYFKLDGHHIQFNVVDADTLRAAQQHPEQYRDLIVRVAGYSDYFCDLTPALQEEIIARTEHQSF